MIMPRANGTNGAGPRLTGSSTTAAAFTPALAYGVLTPVFDLATALLGFGTRFAEEVAELAGARPGESVLDLGCGTGRLLAALVRRQPRARYVGVDPDPHVVAMARRRLKGLGGD